MFLQIDFHSPVQSFFYFYDEKRAGGGGGGGGGGVELFRLPLGENAWQC